MQIKYILVKVCQKFWTTTCRFELNHDFKINSWNAQLCVPARLTQQVFTLVLLSPVMPLSTWDKWWLIAAQEGVCVCAALTRRMLKKDLWIAISKSLFLTRNSLLNSQSDRNFFLKLTALKSIRSSVNSRTLPVARPAQGSLQSATCSKNPATRTSLAFESIRSARTNQLTSQPTSHL